MWVRYCSACLLTAALSLPGLAQPMSKEDAAAIMLTLLEACSKAFPEKAASLEAEMKKQAPPDWEAILRQVQASPKYEESARYFRQAFAGLPKEQLREECDKLLPSAPGGQLPQ